MPFKNFKKTLAVILVLFASQVFSNSLTSQLANISIFNQLENPSKIKSKFTDGMANKIALSPEWENLLNSIKTDKVLPRSLALNFPGHNYILQINSFRRHDKDNWACTGKINGSEYSWFSLGYYKGTISLDLYDDIHNEGFKIRKHNEKSYEIYNVANVSEKFSNIQNRHICPPAKENIVNFEERLILEKKSAAVADTPVVNLGIIWSEEAEQAIGGEDVMMAEILRTEVEFNQILKQSLINLKWNLVYAGKTNLEESTNFIGLTAFSMETFTVTDTIKSLKLLYGLDHICMIQASGFGSQAVGMGFIGGSAVLYKNFNSDFFTAFHEFGHGLGLSHERSETQNIDPLQFNFPYGFKDDSNVWSWTIMVSTVNPYIIPYFSNPLVVYKDVPLGAPEGSLDSLGNPIAADNARYINDYMGTRVANEIGDDLHVTIDRKYIYIPPNGVQEFKVRYSNTSTQPIANISINVSNITNGEILDATAGGIIGDGTIIWDNIPDLPAAAANNPSFGSELFFRVRINPGETVLSEPYISATNGQVKSDDPLGIGYLIGARTKVDSLAVNLGGAATPQKFPMKRLIVFKNNLFLRVPLEAKKISVFDISGTLLWKEAVHNQTSIQVPKELPQNGVGIAVFE